ncbi:hypothetical protein NKJ23_28430 [Mesorhizobium sp. M0184]|uniref:hypothetical protein n=1 Tax=unclassified Mesorhizobium TaxID=325217 RepID=UPI003338E91B
MAAFEHDKLPEKRASVMQQMTFPKVCDRTFQNASEMNNVGKLALTSGSSQPQFLLAPGWLCSPPS